MNKTLSYIIRPKVQILKHPSLGVFHIFKSLFPFKSWYWKFLTEIWVLLLNSQKYLPKIPKRRHLITSAQTRHFYTYLQRCFFRNYLLRSIYEQQSETDFVSPFQGSLRNITEKLWKTKTRKNVCRYLGLWRFHEV